VTARTIRLAVLGLLAAGFALVAALWPSRATSRPPAVPAGAGAEPADVDSGAAAVVPSGATLFLAKGCGTCHNGPDTTARFPVAPNLSTIGQRAGSTVEGLDAEAYVRQSVREPQAHLAENDGNPTVMPTLPMSDAELDALVAYLLG
jgi:cytochrome c1